MDGLKPGRIVYYVFSEADAAEVNGRRAPTDFGTDKWPRGAQFHIGTPVLGGDIFPAMVVRVCNVDGPAGSPRIPEGTVNLKVFLDGADDYWATGVRFSAPLEATDGTRAHGGHTWHWMFAGQDTRYDPTKVKA